MACSFLIAHRGFFRQIFGLGASAVVAGVFVGLLQAGVAPARADNAVHSAPVPAMTLKVVRSNKPGCDPNCPEWIAFEGRITHDSFAQFRAFIRTIGSRKLPILIQSPGGSMNDAMAIGRLIRAKGLDVAVARTAIDSCSPDSKACAGRPMTGEPAMSFAYCMSACPIVLAGGVHREIPLWAEAGVHQIALFRRSEEGQPGKGRPEPLTSPYYTQLARYLAEMGIAADNIMPLIKGTPPSGIHVMTPDEMTATHLATSRPSFFTATGVVASLYQRFSNPVVAKLPTPKPVQTVAIPAVAIAPTITVAPGSGAARATMERSLEPGQAQVSAGSVAWTEQADRTSPEVRATVGMPAVAATASVGFWKDGPLLRIHLSVAAEPGTPLGQMNAFRSIDVSDKVDGPSRPLMGLMVHGGGHDWSVALPDDTLQADTDRGLLQSYAWMHFTVATKDGQLGRLSFEKGLDGWRLISALMCDIPQQPAPLVASIAPLPIVATVAAATALPISPPPDVVRGRAVMRVEEPDGRRRVLNGSVIWSLDTKGQSASTATPALDGIILVPDGHLTLTMRLASRAGRSVVQLHKVQSESDILALIGPSLRGPDGSRTDRLRDIVETRTGDDWALVLPDGAARRTIDLDLLQRPSWIDFRLYLADGRRAWLSVDKGPSGAALFEAVLAPWRPKQASR